jgi:hypothetical protein
MPPEHAVIASLTMVYGEGTALIQRSSRDILNSSSTDRYRQADTKIRKVHGIERRGNEGLLRYSGRVLGLPTPMVEHAWRLVPYSRLEIRSLRPDSLLDRFEGLFLCEETPQGTVVVHRETFALRPPVGRLVEPFLRAWIARDVPREVLRMKSILEGDRDCVSTS